LFWNLKKFFYPNNLLLKVITWHCFGKISCIYFFVFFHLNFTADVDDEAWQTADDIRENTDEIHEDTAEPVLEDAITITTNDEDLENTDEAVTPAMVEILDDKLERKPEEELFVLVDDDLDNDMTSSHAAAFYRVDPLLEQTSSAAATSQPLSPGKTSAAEGDAVKEKTTEKIDADVTHQDDNEDAAAAKTKTTDKTTPKRLVFGAEWVRRLQSECRCIHR